MRENIKSKTYLLWNLFVELRKEIVGSQRIRVQIIGVKIAFISASIGAILVNKERIDSLLLIIPAFAAIFFDYLIYSYGYSIKRIGYYCRKCIEPQLKILFNWPAKYKLWEEFINSPRVNQHFSVIGNLGITILTVILATIEILNSNPPRGLMFILIMLLGLFLYDVFLHMRKYEKDWSVEKDFKKY